MYKRRLISVAVLSIIQAACGGGGGGGISSFSGASVSGAVPGTVIEAFGDNGSYYVSSSTDDGSARHPFTLDVPPNVGFHLVMTTGEDTPDEVVTPIGFRDSSGRVRTRLVLDKGEKIDLGYIPLPMGRNEAAGDDRDGDGVLDRPLVLDDAGAENPLSQSDVDDDGVNDWDDPDHGGYHYGSGTEDPQDHDDDGVPNVYDNDDGYEPHEGDHDGDGLPNHIDANPENDPRHRNDALDDDCDRDGYNDEDHDHDGFHDDDNDRDGYHDDDRDHDGDHDSDHDEDGEDDDEGHSCSGGSGTTQPTPDQPTPDQPAPDQPAPDQPNPGLDGQALFVSYCARCHSPVEVSGSSANLITSAINNNTGGMRTSTLTALTADQIQAIAAYLAP